MNVWEQLQLSLELCSILVQHSIYFNSISAKCFKLVQQLLEITHLAFDIGRLVCFIYSIRGGNTRLLPLKTKLKVPCGVSDSQYYFPFLWRRSSFDICEWHKTSCQCDDATCGDNTDKICSEEEVRSKHRCKECWAGFANDSWRRKCIKESGVTEFGAHSAEGNCITSHLTLKKSQQLVLL